LMNIVYLLHNICVVRVSTLPTTQICQRYTKLSKRLCMKNFTSALGKLGFSFVFILLSVLVNAQTYSTDPADWTQEWNSSSGIYQATGGVGIYSFGTDVTSGQVNSRNFTSDGTTSGTNQAMQVGQKLTIKLAAPVGGGRSGIQSGGRIGFDLKNRVSFFDGGTGQARYFNGSMLRYEYQGGQSAAQLVDGTGTTTTGMPGFTDFTNGITYEVEVISDKEYNFQVVSGSRFNIRSFSSTGQLQQISIANLGENRDGVYTNFVISNMTTVGLTANTGETFTVAGVISNKATANTVTKLGAGTVVLTGQNTYSGATTVSAGTLQLNGASPNTIKSGNAITVSNGATLRISQDQTVGTLTLPTGANLIVDAGKTLTINGIFNSGGNIQNNGTIKLAGSLPQSFPGSGTISAMNNLTINNNSVTLDNAGLNVTGTLSFIQKFSSPSILSTGSNVITATTVSGAGSTSGWVNGNLARNISAPGTVSYDIGDAANYLPVSLVIQAPGFTAGTLQVSTRTPLSSTSGYSTLSLETSNTINRVWSVFKPSGSTFFAAYTGTYTYLAEDVTGSPDFLNFRSGFYDGFAWAYSIANNSGLQINQGTAKYASSTGDLVFGMPQPVTISGITVDDKTYDGGTTAIPNFEAVQINGLLNGDDDVTVNDNNSNAEFEDKNAGINKNVTISPSINLIGSQNAAYYITSIQTTAQASILPLPIIITAAPNTKQYDGNVSAAAIPTITSGAIQGFDEAAFTESYATPDIGTGKELIPEGVVNDGNSGNNYNYSFVSSFDGEITSVQITINSATPGTISCSGGTTTLTVSANGGVGQLLYSLSGTASFPNQASNIFTGVGAGTYTLTVTDESEAFETLSDIVITEPQTMSASFTVTDESVCAVTPDGAITVSPSGGTEPYTYTWSGVVGSGNPATTPYTGGTNSAGISNLQYGFYNVNIADANGCNINVNDIHVKKAHLAVITHNGEVSSSCGNTGTLIIYASAGVAPYTYSADGINYQSSNSITGLAAGPMTIYVKDAGGCVSTKDYTILSAPELTISPYVVAASSCNDDGSVKIYRTGGIPPYTYSVDGSPFLTSNLFTGMAAGTHTATVKDSKGCEASVEVIVGQGVGLTATVSRKANSSACVNNGSFQVSVTGGVGPFTYSVDGGEPQPSNSFAGLGAGNYVVTVTDSRGCTGTTNVTINVNYINVNSIVVNAPNCSGTGSIKLMPAGGGTSPYTYSLDGDNYQTSPWFYNLAPGTYTGYIKDNNTCIGQTADGGIVVGPEDCNNNMRAVAPLKNMVEQAIAVKVFPNPSVNEFMLDLKGFNMNEKVMITVTDLLGRKVYQTEGTGMMQYRIGNRLLAGMYNVTIDQGERHFALKVVKE